MAIIAVPLTTVYLVEHISGGAILHAGGGYIAGTLIPESVVSAVAAASTTLASLSSSAAAIASSPIVIGVTITVAVAGAYCYFYGIPAPIEALLVKAGIGSAAKGGLAIAIAKAATAFVVLGAAGLLAFNIFKRVDEARQAERDNLSFEQARTYSEEAFGPSLWQQFGEAAWLGAQDTGGQIVDWAQKAVDASTALIKRPATVGDAIGTGLTVAAGAGGAVAGAAYAASTVTVLGSSALGGVGLSLGLVSAPLWPIIAGGVGAAGLGYVGWKALRSTLKREKPLALPHRD